MSDSDDTPTELRHEVEAEADIMEGLEVKALATLGIANPYRDMAA